MSINVQQLEREIASLGREIFSEMSAQGPSVLSAQFYTDKMMSWAMEDEALKISLFRFIDVLPCLQDSAAIIRHVQEYFAPLEDKLPSLLRQGLSINPNSIAAAVAGKAIKSQVKGVAERFILGEDPKRAMPKLRDIRRSGAAFTVDLVGECAVSEHEARDYMQRYATLLEQLAKEVPRWKESSPLLEGHRAEQWPINISVKPSALYSQAKPVSSDFDILVLVDRFSELLSLAKKANSFVYFDMEDTSLTTSILQAFKQVLSSTEFKDFPQCGIVLQAYLRRTRADLEDLITWVNKRDVPIAVRLVKGAYWDTESILAKQQGWVVPVWEKKVCSDAAFEALSILLLEHHKLILPAFASHNIRSLCHAVKAAEQLRVPPTEFELQCLYGMANPIKIAFSERGFLVREYAPIGELIPGMGYLVRRLLENTSNEGFLRQSFHEHRDPEVLLKRPEFIASDTGTAHINTSPGTTFSNSPARDFSLTERRAALKEALDSLANSTRADPRVIRPIIGGEEISSNDFIYSVSPAARSHILAKIELASVENAAVAIERLTGFFPKWRDTPVAERVAILRRTASIIEDRREEFTALVILEAGKPWVEADADIAECVDFLNYYAHEALRLFKTSSLGSLQGEENSYFYEPRGVTAVISPWNFPAAIPCGMFAAALVCGNCAVLKPAEQTSAIAGLLIQAFLEAGLPADAFSFLPGRGEDVGAFLGGHPAVSTVVFTGSLEVGLKLIAQIGQAPSGGGHVRRVIAEMGGKNAIIIDDDADLDEAVKGVVQSAFGYSGQKCSACSRVLVHQACYDRFISRLTRAVLSIRVGNPSEPSTLIGPVIDEAARERILNAISQAKASCKLLVEYPLDKELLQQGFYVPPTIFTDIPRGSPILEEEIFGPVLAVIKVSSFEDAVSQALDSKYALTGAVYSRSPKNIEYAARNFRVGNLYINRGCTGALVMRQPFGGAKMSGVGSKAGGPDYLLQFVTPRVVTENTLRRGFAPAVGER